MARLTVSKKSLLAEGSDKKFRAFIHDFLIFAARLEAIREGFGTLLGLTGAGYTALMAIAFLEGEEGVGVHSVAGHLHLSGSFITLEVAKLVEAGLVVKRPNDQDRRRVLLTLSQKGREKLDALTAIQAPVNDSLFDCLTEQDFAFLQALMPKLVLCGEDALVLLNYLSARRPVPEAESLDMKTS
jgi:MarR family transcriptional regulator, organic hydroperoxide resistance regulator